MKFIADHFAFQVFDMDQAINFYTKNLGMTFLSRQTDEEHGEEFSYLEIEGGNLELLQKIPPTKLPEKPSPSTTANCPHLALRVSNFDEFVEHLDKSETEIASGPFSIPNQVKWVYIADPDGNLIEFVEWLKNEK